MTLSSKVRNLTIVAIFTGFMWGLGMMIMVDSALTGDYAQLFVQFVFAIGLLAFLIYDWNKISNILAEANEKLSIVKNNSKNKVLFSKT